jgi:ABC-type lipoprotein release transport system permease subunit
MATLQLIGPLAWRSLWRNRNRTLIAMAVVAAGVYSILCFAAILHAWARSSRDMALHLMIGSGQIHAPGYLDDPTVQRRMPPPGPALLAALNSAPIAAWSERVRVPAVVQSEYQTLPVTLVGVDPGREVLLSRIPRQIATGRYLQQRDDAGVVLGTHLAGRLKTRVGKRVIVLAQADDGTLAQRSFRVVGLFGGNVQAEDTFLFTGCTTAQAMLGIGDGYSEISFDVARQEHLAAAVSSLRRLAPGLDVRPWTELSPLAAAMDDFMNAFVYVWLWVMFVLIAIGIVNTQLMAVMERVREFGLLAALGMRPRLILAQVALEAVMLIGIGAAAGALGAVATVAALHRGVDLGRLAQGAEMFGAGRMLYPRLDPGQCALIVAVIWACGVLVALWPALRAARSNPVEAMSHAT